MLSRNSYTNILQKKPEDLLSWLVDTFVETLPDGIFSAEDMAAAGRQMLRLTNSYSYLCELSAAAKRAVRTAKRSGTKEEQEDAIDRKEIVENITSSVKQQYAALSRAVTIRIENNEELRMASGEGIRRR